MPLPDQGDRGPRLGRGVADPDQPRRPGRAGPDAQDPAVAGLGQRLLVQHLDRQARLACRRPTARSANSAGDRSFGAVLTRSRANATASAVITARGQARPWRPSRRTRPSARSPRPAPGPASCRCRRRTRPAGAPRRPRSGRCSPRVETTLAGPARARDAAPAACRTRSCSAAASSAESGRRGRRRVRRRPPGRAATAPPPGTVVTEPGLPVAPASAAALHHVGERGVGGDRAVRPRVGGDHEARRPWRRRGMRWSASVGSSVVVFLRGEKWSSGARAGRSSPGG